MNLGLNGTLAYLAGGTGALGVAICATLLGEGARVVVLGRDRARLETAREGILDQVGASAPSNALICVEADLSNEDVLADQVDTIVSEHGAPETLVSAVGSTERIDVSHVRAADFEAVLQSKFLPNVRLVLAVGERMRERRRGRIVVVSGVGGVQPMAVHLAGGSANAALSLFSIGYARAIAADGVALNVVNPGAVESPRLEGHLAARAEAGGVSIEQARADLMTKIPAGRPATPAEVAAVVAFVASPASSYLVAASVNVDGGQVVGP